MTSYQPTDLRASHAVPGVAQLEADDQRRNWQLIAEADNAAAVALLHNATREEAEREAAMWGHTHRRFAEVEPYDGVIISFNDDGLFTVSGGAL